MASENVRKESPDGEVIDQIRIICRRNIDRLWRTFER